MDTPCFKKDNYNVHQCWQTFKVLGKLVSLSSKVSFGGFKTKVVFC